MKSRKTAKLISLMISILLSFSVLPIIAFAQEIPNAQETDQIQLEKEETSSGAKEINTEEKDTEKETGTNTETKVKTDLETDTGTEKDTDTGTGTKTKERQVDDEKGDVKIEPEEENTEAPEDMSADVEVNATSNTNNIVGEVLANMVNSYGDDENEAKKKASLKEYPLEHHELEYYGDSLRVRMVEGGDSEGSNYLVYRDSYLLISEKESSNYTVSYSEDGTEAYISPAIPASELGGKTGIVFLTDDVGNDNILVFDGEPVYDEDGMTVPILTADEVTINQLFSDGKLSMEQEYSQPQNSRANKMLKGSSVSTPFVAFNTEVSGKNWSAEIDSFAVKDLDFDSYIDLFDLEASMTISMATEMGFKLEAKGDTEGRSTAKIASITVPVKYVDFTVSYSMQFECNGQHNLYTEGKMNNTIGFTLSTSRGREISQFSTPIKLNKFENNNEDKNKPVEFYIGSQFQWQGGALSVTIPVIDVDIGPVISVNLTNTGGSRFTVKQEKDLYTKGQKTGNEIHSCAIHGEPGCLDFDVIDLENHRFFFRIDLYFWDKDFDFNERLPKIVREYNMYESLTYNSGIMDGVCPHRFCKVPVAVWSDPDKTTAVAGMNVSAAGTVRHTAEEEYLISGVTGSDGRADVYLPYFDKQRYTIIASGKLEGQTFAGSAQMSHYIRRDGNDRVDICLSSDEKVTIKTNLIWNTDLNKQEVPGEYFVVCVIRRKAGTNDEWERLMAGIEARKDNEWKVPDQEYGKYGIEGEKVFLYEYRVTPIYVDGSNSRVIDPDGDPIFSYVEYGVNPYVDAVGDLEPEHRSRFYIDSNTETQGNIIYSTITATPGIDIRVNKKWRLSEEGSEVPVYLAVLRKPAEGWGEKAEERNVAPDWLPVTNPLAEGAADHTRSTTLAKLKEASIVSVHADISSISNNRLAIAEVSSDNRWRITYTVPKFQNGIKMQFQGGEIDSMLMEKLLASEYDLDADVEVKDFGDFTSVSYSPNMLDYATFDADVVNMDPVREGTLRGTVRWQNISLNWWDDIPETVKLTVKKDGEPISESPIILNKNDYSWKDDTWVWTLDLDDYDPEAKYTVEEETEYGMLNRRWVPEYDGIDVVNSYIRGEAVFVDVRVSFEDTPNIEQLGNIIIKDGRDTINNLTVKKSEGWYTYALLGGTRNYRTRDNVKDITDYTFEAPDIPGYEKFYEAPVATGKGTAWGNLTYSYSVRYMKTNTDLEIRIDKEILDNGDPEVPYDSYPDEVTVKLYRDGVWINDAVLIRSDNDEGKWKPARINRDNEGKLLRRMDENGHKYVYTFSEERVDGFTSEIKLLEDWGGILIYKISNEWVGPDHVHIKGKIDWEGDEGKTHLRPGSVRLSVINSKGEYVRSIDVPVNDDGTYESKYLPGKDSDGNPLNYSVLQSKAPGYTSTYSEPAYDEETRTWTCDVTNTLTGYFPMTIKKEIEGVGPEDKETYRFRVKPLIEGVPEGKVAPEFDDERSVYDIRGEGTAKVEFLLDKDGLYYYRFYEEEGNNPSCTYDTEERIILISRSTQKNGDDSKAEFKSWIVDKADVASSEKGSMEKLTNNTVLFTNKYPGITIEKKWDIDLEGKDRPESIQAVLQKKTGEKWDDVQVVELNEENGWKSAVAKSDENADYRVRELKQEGTIGRLTDKIVYDRTDSDKGESAANEVIFSVDGYESVLSGTETAHKTEYQVSYKQDGDKYTITNKAILKIDTIKRWLSNDEDKIPDSVWLVLLCSPKAGALDNAASIASALGLDISSVLDYEFPVINPVSGGINPVDLLSQLTIGVDLSIFSKVLPTLSIGKATKDGNWKHEFVVSKYNMGIPMEYKGAELGSEIIRQVIKYVANVNLPVSYNPIQNFFSISTKAIRTVMGLTDLDLSNLSGKALEKAQTLGEDDIKNFSPETPLDDWHLMANVINMIIDWDTDDDDDDDDDDPGTKTLKGSKTWVDDNEADRPEYIKIHIKDGSNEIEESPVTLNKADFEGKNEWTWSIKVDADKYKYATFVVSEEYPDNYEYKNYYSCENDGLDLTNSWQNTEVKTLNIQGQKIWKDENNRDGLRPEKLKVYLLADGNRVEGSDGDDLSVETNEAGGWRYFFPNQPKYNDDGEEIKYSVEEVNVTGYSCEVDGLNLVNSHTPDKTQIRAQVSWNDKDNQDGIRPKTTVIRLFADGKDTGREFTLAEANNWTATFEDLYVSEAGKKINYTVVQDKTDVITGVDGDGTYSFETTGDASEGFTITNKHTPLVKDIKFEKIWDDDNDRDGKRPNAITVKLMADGEAVESQIVTAANGWKHTFADMPVYKDGNRIDYTLLENNVNEYAKSISGNADKGFIITNKHTPDKIEFDVIKIWDDDNNRDGKRPQSVTVELLSFDEEADEYIPIGKRVVLSGQNKWRYSFSNLNKYDNGKEIKYMVRETETIPGYEFTMMGNMEENFALFGIHEPERKTITGRKVWDDADNQDNARPESITIRLRADGRVVDDKIVTTSDDWKWEFKDVYRYESGQEIKYSISEDVIDEYTSSISGNADEGFVVTNVHSPYKTQVNVYKVWEDTGDIEGFRPSSVNVDLYADGEKTDKSLILNEDNDFSGSFVNLDKNKAGKEIQYTVREEMTDIVTGSDGAGTYAPVITGDRYEGYTITNIHTPHFIEVPVDVEWDDGDDRDGIRPEYVSVRLLYDEDEQYGMAFVCAENDWEGVAFINVPEYLEGKKLEYTASEDEIEGYEIRLSGDAKSGFRFTNVHVPETTSVDVSKVWDDADDRNGIRPESVTVKLLSDGEDTGKTLELSEENKWTGSFEDLYKNSAGKEIVYSVDEVRTETVTGSDDKDSYSSEVKGDMKQGFTITNRHTPWYKIIYDLNGGVYNGDSSDITEEYKSGKEISIHDAPTRKGYKFLYWKGSEYQPGDKYTVTEDHRFVAQWEKDKVPPDPDPDPSPDPDPDPNPNPDPDPDPSPNPDPDLDPSPNPNPDPSPNPNPSPEPGPDKPGRSVATGDPAGMMLYVASGVGSLFLLLLMVLKRRIHGQ